MNYECNECEFYFPDNKMFAERQESMSAITYEYYCKKCALKLGIIENDKTKGK